MDKEEVKNLNDFELEDVDGGLPRAPYIPKPRTHKTYNNTNGQPLSKKLTPIIWGADATTNSTADDDTAIN